MKKLNPIWSVSKHESISAVKIGYAEIVKALWKISLEGKSRTMCLKHADFQSFCTVISL